nr:helix-turn-helix domain-containing protein [Amycolatopsis benzoatilytica]
MPTGSAFGDVLRFYRIRRRMTQEELADRTGISLRAISYLESGRTRKPQRRTVELLVAGLGLAADEARGLGETVVQVRRISTSERSPGQADPLGAGAFCRLPPILHPLVGRDLEYRALGQFAQDAKASRRVPMAVIHGPPGVGKTALALEAGHALAERFSGGCLYVNLRGTSSQPLCPSRVVYRLLRAFGVDERAVPAAEDERVALYQSLLADQEVLVILDDASDEAQVRPLFAASSGSAIVVTSQSTMSGLSVRHRIPLSTLDQGSGLELLASVVGSGRVAAELDAARRVVDHCGGFPLALVIAGNRLASRPNWGISHLADQLKDERRRLSLLAAGDLQVRAAFEVSYRQLGVLTARIFRLLALTLGPDASAEVLAVLAGQSRETCEASLEELVDSSLLKIGCEAGRYRCDTLLRIFARERLEQDERPEDITAAAKRLREWSLAVVQKAAQVIDSGKAGAALAAPGPDPVHDRVSAMRWLDHEAETWFFALRNAALHHEHRLVLAVTRSIFWYSVRWGTGRLWAAVYTMGVNAARALEDAEATVEQLNLLAWTQHQLCGRVAEAQVTNDLATAAAAEAEDVVGEAWAWYGRASIERCSTSARSALHLARHSVALFSRAGDADGHHLALSLLGSLLQTLGDFEEAVEVNRVAAAYFRSAADRPGNDRLLPTVLFRLAESMAAAGQPGPAQEILEEADDELRSMPGVGRAPEVRIDVLVALAQLADQRGERAKARECRLRALAECERYGVRAIQATAERLEAELSREVSQE